MKEGLVLALVAILLVSVQARGSQSLGHVTLEGNENTLRGLVQAIHQKELDRIEDVLGVSKRSASTLQEPKWRDILVQAVERDLYHTANSALATLRELVSRGELSLNNLECAGSEQATLSSGETGNFVLLSATSDESRSADSRRMDSYLYRAGAGCKEGILHLPQDQYDPPYEVAQQTRSIVDFTQHADVIQFATQHLAQRGPDPLRPVYLSEETRQYKHCGAKSYLVAVISVEDETTSKREYMLVVYYPPASAVIQQHSEKEYSIHFAGENSKHHVLVSATSPGNFEVIGRSSTPTEAKRRDNPPAPPAWKVMSYNIWNFNADWEARRALIVTTIQETQPDVVGFQEIRYRYGSSDSNQLAQIAASFPSYNYIYQPAMRYPTEAEGVGIMTKYPIVFSNYTNLKFTPGSADSNTRIVLRTALDAPQPLDFFVTHFSYAKGAGQMQNAVDLLNFMDLSNKNDPAQVVVGDFNIYTDSLGPTNFLTGKQTFNGRTGNLRDVWEVVHGSEDGFTFSNLPWSTGLINRADRILTRGNTVPTTVQREGVCGSGCQAPASDHLAVLAQFS